MTLAMFEWASNAHTMVDNGIQSFVMIVINQQKQCTHFRLNVSVTDSINCVHCSVERDKGLFHPRSYLHWVYSQKMVCVVQQSQRSPLVASKRAFFRYMFRASNKLPNKSYWCERCSWSEIIFFWHLVIYQFPFIPERRHGSSSKAPLTPPSSSVYSLYSTPSTKNKVAGSSTRTSSSASGSASSNSKLIKSPKEKLQIGGNNRSMHPTQHSKAPQDKM